MERHTFTGGAIWTKRRCDVIPAGFRPEGSIVGLIRHPEARNAEVPFRKELLLILRAQDNLVALG